ncbi:MAG: hypothetical protein KJ550_13415 [Proteobacteria bacterium]|nr:hypothetical protein [Desulfobacteraceae bacterium]MBU3980960.1 hypothetical protein [Pseudomonadota bacterium]MBU4014444.1 hypothetical protein [Pseudomonadota bacterium]MBU4067395.1 hypothetical protein [Pseudomonadota bacterium]MBU4101981.1 hypothetical protein [Pseudomonadota bacterium]
MIITDFIVCEDVRFEVTGQQSLIGVYHENIQFTVTSSNRGVWPKHLSLAVFTRLLFEQKDTEKNICKIELFVGLKGDLISVGKPADIDKTKLDDHGRIVMTAVLKNFPLKGPGNFLICLKAYNEDDELVAEVSSPCSVEIKEVVR